MCEELQLLHILPSSLHYQCLIPGTLAIIMSVQWYLFMVLICVSLMIFNIFTCAYLPYLYLLWWSLKILCLFLSRLFVSSLQLSFKSSLFRIKVIFSYMDLSSIIPGYAINFPFLSSVFNRARLLNFKI